MGAAVLMEGGENLEVRNIPESCGILKRPKDHHTMEPLVALRLIEWRQNQRYFLCLSLAGAALSDVDLHASDCVGLRREFSTRSHGLMPINWFPTGRCQAAKLGVPRQWGSCRQGPQIDLASH